MSEDQPKTKRNYLKKEALPFNSADAFRLWESMSFEGGYEQLQSSLEATYGYRPRKKLLQDWSYRNKWKDKIKRCRAQWEKRTHIEEKYGKNLVTDRIDDEIGLAFDLHESLLQTSYRLVMRVNQILDVNDDMSKDMLSRCMNSAINCIRQAEAIRNTVLDREAKAEKEAHSNRVMAEVLESGGTIAEEETYSEGVFRRIMMKSAEKAALAGYNG